MPFGHGATVRTREEQGIGRVRPRRVPRKEGGREGGGGRLATTGGGRGR